MNFKVGQRVRKIANRAPQDIGPGPNGPGGRINATGTVHLLYPDDEVAVLWDEPRYRSTHPSGTWLCRPYMLAPLLPPDPYAEQFMEWVRALDKAPLRELQPDEMERVRSAG